MNTDWTGNNASMWKIIGASNHTENDRELNDYYATDPIAIDKLLTVESPARLIWEPACGGGHLSDRLLEHNYTVISTDLIDRGYKHFDGETDFLQATAPPVACDFDILTNPPYKYALEFVKKSLELLPEGRRAYMFLKLTFLEGKKRFNELFKITPPSRVHVFTERVLCAKNGDFERMKEGGGSAVAYGWFVWEKGYKGVTNVDWI